eukprot:COSAG02_NODE_55793_length_288_cov_1.211640_1_plen_50_part_10
MQGALRDGRRRAHICPSAQVEENFIMRASANACPKGECTYITYIHNPQIR